MASRGGRGRFQPRAGFMQTEKQTSGVHPAMLKQARKSGQLNLSGRSLNEVPDSVWRINIDVPEEAKTVSLDNAEDRWWEQIDLTKLILASNKLKFLSEDIKELPALTVLDVHDNELESLPDALGELSTLQRLMLSHNKLSHLPKSACKLRNLLTLHLEHNCLTELDDDIGKFIYLEDFNVGNNMLTSVPKSIGYMTKVTKLNLANNNLTDLPPEIGSMNALRYLDVNHNQLSYLPTELGILSHLEQLYLRHNRLKKLPLLSKCTSLKELHVGNNCITELSADLLGPLSELSVLDIRDNKIAVLPVEMTLMEGLERLDLTNNDLSGLPYEMGNMTKLKAVVLDGNPMKGIRRDIIMRGTNELKKYLRSRIAPDEPQNDAPKATKDTHGQSGIIGGGDGVDAHTVESTKTLEYCNKMASSIPEDIWGLAVNTGITTVNISKNAVTELPNNLMVTVDTLNNLNLGFNKLTVLNPDIGLYAQLTFLDLRNNLLSDLPKEMSRCQSMREVIISCNRFKQIPPVLYELCKLENLLASDNQIGLIDVGGLQRLPVLATLDLQNNDIMQVPPELGNCSNLRSLQLGGNPFRNPRPAILSKGTVALLEFLKDRIVS